MLVDATWGLLWRYEDQINSLARFRQRANKIVTLLLGDAPVRLCARTPGRTKSK